MSVSVLGNGNSKQGLVQLLQKMVDKEDAYFHQRKAKTVSGLQKGHGLVTGDERDAAVRWMCSLAKGVPRPQGGTTGAPISRWAFGCDSVCLAVCFLDEILTTTRVQSKYLNCLSLTSLYLAVKLCEEPELVPFLADLNRVFCNSQYSIHELTRMERVLLTRLNWQLSYPTIDGFIQLMLAISFPLEVGMELMERNDAPMALQCSLEKVLSSHHLFLAYSDSAGIPPVKKPHCAGPRIGALTNGKNPKSKIGGSHSQAIGFKPSLLALALFSLALEARGFPHWFLLTAGLQEMLKVEVGQFILCRERVSLLLQKDGDKENLQKDEEFRMSPATSEDEVFQPVTSLGNGGGKKLSPRKRLRQRSKGSGSGSSTSLVERKVKMPPERIFVDEIADSIHILYGNT